MRSKARLPTPLPAPLAPLATQRLVSPLSPDAPPGTAVILRLDDSATWEVLKRDWWVVRGELKKGAALPTVYVERV